MDKQQLPTDAELDSSLSTVFGAARASGRVANLAAHTAIVENAARKGLQTLRLLPEIKKALGPKGTKAQHAQALKTISELTGEPHQEEPDTDQE